MAEPHSQPPWTSLTQSRRIQSELKHMQRLVASGHPQLARLEPTDDNLYCWRFQVKHFDDGLEGGRLLNADLARLAREHNQDHLLMEVQFPADYPAEPLFMRVVSPRCVAYTGHITLGGSVCVQALVQTPGGWRSDYSFESMLNLVLMNMVDCEAATVVTPMGRTVLSGTLRVDFDCMLRSRQHVLQAYSVAEARSAYTRMVATHGVSGWDAGGAQATPLSAGPRAAPPPRCPARRKPRWWT